MTKRRDRWARKPRPDPYTEMSKEYRKIGLRKGTGRFVRWFTSLFILVLVLGLSGWTAVVVVSSIGDGGWVIAVWIVVFLIIFWLLVLILDWLGIEIYNSEEYPIRLPWRRKRRYIYRQGD